MKTIARLLMLGLALVVTLGCPERTERTDSGGVLLEVAFVDTVGVVSVNANPRLSIETITVNSIVAQPGGATSSLMDVEVESYEVTYQRVDNGTRVPPAFVNNILSTVPVGGTLTLTNYPVMTVDQLRNPPLSDLLFENGGFDKETGNTNIKLNLTIRFFGRTLSGREVSSVPRAQTIEFVQ
ncbi:MAG: hypothetical protein HC897_08720 [Thermoanaerobaculia bacterium]|nr:hypothetical protein [Thermoanaerobaculia bacterium]